MNSHHPASPSHIYPQAPGPTDSTRSGTLARIVPSVWARLFLGVPRTEILILEDHLRVTLGEERNSIPLDGVKEVKQVSGRLWDRVEVERPDGARLILNGLRRKDAQTLVGAIHLAAALREVEAANRSFKALLGRDAYFNRQALLVWQRQAAVLREQELVPAVHSTRLPISDRTRSTIAAFLDRLKNGVDIVETRNTEYARRVLGEYRDLFDHLEAKPLTDRQRECIVHDEDRCLVVAGAGSGKTSVVVAKVGFLLRHDRLNPREILVLSYSSQSKQDVERRLHERLGEPIPVRTFHSLGKRILKKVEGREPNVSHLAQDRSRKAAIARYLEELLASPKHRPALLSFLAYHRFPERSASEFDTLGEYYDHLKAHALVTLRGEPVKSWAELIIANSLCLNGVPYEYERVYEHAVSTGDRRPYHPDFWLPDCAAYLEHWGIDREGNTAPGIDARKYREGMQWKRNVHSIHKTRLLETYSYDHTEGKLLDRLWEQLRAEGVRKRPLFPHEIKALLAEHKHLPPVVSLLATFLSLFKGNLWSLPQLRHEAGKRPDSTRLTAFLNVFELIYEKYEAELRAANEIDFDDMIARATEYVRSGRYRVPFRRIIVDEFQDISRGRGLLLQALLEQGPTDRRLFCVGDDWQSIYRFTGSDVGIMTSFKEVFGFTRHTYLDRTFRFNNQILRFSTHFIQQNAAQLPKQIQAQRRVAGPAVTLRADVPGSDGSPALVRALEEIEQWEASNPRRPEVLLLGRYQHCRPENFAELRRRFRKLALDFKTIHASKGLETDYAVVLDLSDGKYGFPSAVADDPVLGLVLPREGGFPHAEERRLFYVAVTRAKHHVFLLSREGRASRFLTEIWGEEYQGLVRGAEAAVARLACPECETGVLRRREASKGVYWTCSHVPYCKRKVQACPRCRTSPFLPRKDELVCADPECGERAPMCERCQIKLWPGFGRRKSRLQCPNRKKTGCTYERAA